MGTLIAGDRVVRTAPIGRSAGTSRRQARGAVARANGSAHPAPAGRGRPVHRRRARRPVLPDPEARRTEPDLGPAESRRPAVARGCRGAGAAVDPRLRDPVQDCLRQGHAAHRLARQHRDPAGGDRGDPAARGGGRRRRGGHGLGAESRRNGTARDRMPDGRQLRDPVFDLSARDHRLRAGPRQPARSREGGPTR